MKKVGLADWRTSNGLPSASDPETEADRTPRESSLACMTANREPSNQSFEIDREATVCTASRRFLPLWGRETARTHGTSLAGQFPFGKSFRPMSLCCFSNFCSSLQCCAGEKQTCSSGGLRERTERTAASGLIESADGKQSANPQSCSARDGSPRILPSCRSCLDRRLGSQCLKWPSF